MRRPPGREEHLTEHQVASANNTLNAFVGGRQKSWMTAASATVRPSPMVGARVPVQQTAKSSSSILPSPAPSDEPSPVASIQHISPDPEPQIRSVAEATSVQTPQPTNFSRPSQVAINTADAQSQQQSQNPTQTTAEGNGQSPGIRSAIWTVPPNRQAYMAQPQAEDSSSFAPMKNGITLKNRTQIIDAHLKSIGGSQNLSPILDLPRFKLLRDACAQEDFFYAALHQIFCLWTFAPAALDGNVPNCDNNTLTRGLQILGQLIKENDSLDPLNLRWFSFFPGNFADLAARSKPYQNAIAKVGHFLSKLSSEWTRFNHECSRRSYPPLVDELVGCLFLTSPVLQQVIFTATRRNLNLKDDNFGQQAEDVFQKDLTGHIALSSRYNTNRPPTQKEINDRNSYLIGRYLQIQQQRLSSANNSPRTINNSTGYSSQAPSPSVPSVDGRFQNSPNMVNSARSSPQVQQMNFQRNLSNGQPAFPQPRQLQGQIAQSTVFPSNLVLQSNVPSRTNPTYQHLDAPSSAQNQVSVTNSQNAVLWHQLTADQQVRANRNAATRQSQQQNLNQQQLHINQAHRHNVQYWNQLNPPGQAPPTGSFLGQPPNIGPAPNNNRYSRSSAAIQSQFEMRQPFIPRLHISNLPQAYIPDETALHQAHLKSPQLNPIDIKPSSSDQNATRCYQVISNLVVGPCVFHVPLSMTTFQFSVSGLDISRLPVVVDSYTRNVTTGTLWYRLRCIQLETAETPTESEWVVSDTKWPRSLFMDMNGQENPLELRRKAYHGKDLPVDLTNYVKACGPEQPNTLRATVRRLKAEPAEPAEPPYAIGVEVIEILQHDQIVKRCLESQTISAEETLNKIKASLAGSATSDDDFAIVASDLTIDLADPFMAKIFDIPARGKDCLHRECFDLETFLITRSSKPKTIGQPSMVDVWKCPRCGRDARPQNLIIDGFLVGVRKQLEEHDMLHYKAITITPDGEWKPKPERQPSLKRKEVRADSAGFKDIDDFSDDDEPISMTKKIRAASAGASTRQESEKKEAELIVLDDSD